MGETAWKRNLVSIGAHRWNNCARSSTVEHGAYTSGVVGSNPTGRTDMIKVVGIDHLEISVSNFQRSRKFYGKLFKFLGFKILFQFRGVVGWTNKITRYIIKQALVKYRRHGYVKGMIGFHHYAFELSKKKDVDDLYRFLLENKIKILDPPKFYYEYGGPYYAVFFADPDGLKLEGMHFGK